MSIQVTFDEKDQIVVASLGGEFNWPSIEQWAPQIAACIIENDCHKVLLDMREVKLNLSTVSIYLTPKKLSDELEKFGIDIRRLRRAILVKGPNKDFRFIENVSLNQFQMLRLFSNEQKAREWLKE